MTTESVLITGASSGIGLEMTKLFAAAGSNLILLARSEDKLRRVAEEMRTTHQVEVRVVPMDLAKPDAAQEVYDQLQVEGVSVDVVVNNAGFGALGPVAELPVERQINMIQVNVTALTHLTRLFLPGMLERDRGGILNVASVAGFQAGPYMAVYYASKAYVISFTEALAEEVSHTNVHVTCLAPGATETGFGSDSGMGNARIFKMGSMDAHDVALAGFKGQREGDVLVIPGLKNRLTVFSGRFMPRSVMRKMVKSLQSN